jgi:hypothetical protein
MFRDKEKVKLIASISALLVFAFLITSFSSYFVSRSTLRSEISENTLPMTSDNIYSEIQHDLLRPVFISSLMAHDTFLRDWVLNGERNPEQISKYLREIQTKYNTFTSFFVSEKSQNYYYGDGILKKVSPEEPRDLWYYRVREMAEDYEINVDPDLANKDAMTIFINYKVKDYAGNYIGATGVGLTVSAVKGLIESYQNKYRRTIYFLDDSGEIKISQSDIDPGVTQLLQSELGPRFSQNLAAHTDTVFSYHKDGQLVHVNMRYIDEFEWHLVVEQPEQGTVADIYEALIINLVICIIIVVIVMLLVNLSVTSYQERIETLRGIVPICSYCKQVRDDKGYWNQVEAYVSKYTDARFSHSICPNCMTAHFPKQAEALAQKKSPGND